MYINLPKWKQNLNEEKLHYFKITARTVKIHHVYWVTQLQSTGSGILQENSSSIFTTTADHHLAEDFKWRLSSMPYFIYFLLAGM
jgi:hypothetical protein